MWQSSPMRKTWLVGALLLASFGGALLVYRVMSKSHDQQVKLGDPWFVDATDEMGLDFVHDAGDLSKYQLPQIHGSGVAIFDFDGDDRLDLYLLTAGGTGSRSINRLYRNMPGNQFKDVTEGSGLGIGGHNTGVAVGDINNDGLPDVVVTQYTGVKLFLNRGKGVFTDVTDQAGLKNPLWATSVSFVDYDRDGWLDIIVVNYLDNDPTWICHNPTSQRDYCGPLIFPGTVSKLFRNLGGKKEGVRFEDVTVAAGLTKAAGGLGVYCADYNDDGLPDIFIANDAKPNHLWINQGNGTFKEEAFARGIALDGLGNVQAGMGVAAGDVDGDGLFDIFITHLPFEQHTLWLQGPKRGQFRDNTVKSGLYGSDWRGTGFGTLMGDFDRDGWLDIGSVNGRVTQGTPTPNPTLGDHLKHYSEKNQLFRNQGGGVFQDISRQNPAFCGTPNIARGLAAGDLDGDGALDLVYTQVNDRARILRNVAAKPGHWLMVRAVDPRLKRDAYGAVVTVAAGKRRFVRIINPSDSYQSCSDPRAHFGLGDAATVDSIHILWPDGLAETFAGGKADRVLKLNRGDGKSGGAK